MKKKDKLLSLRVLFLAVVLYIALVFFSGYYTLPTGSASWIQSIYDHFVSVHDAASGDVLFLGVVFGALSSLYYFMIHRPRKVKKMKQVTLARKVIFEIVLGYAFLLVVLPYITLPVGSAAIIVDVFTHFSDVKAAILSDFVFISFTLGLLFTLYKYMWHQVKIKK